MNSATGRFTTLDSFKEDACPIKFAEKETLSPGPALVGIAGLKVFRGDFKLIGNTLFFFYTDNSLVLSAAYAATETCYDGFYLPLFLNKAKARHTARRFN
jgi:hypothetical protein